MKTVVASLLLVVLFAVTAKDLQDYQQDVNRIINFITKQDKGNSYDKLAYFTDTFGPRLLGSENLEKAIHWFYTLMQEEKLENARLEDVPNVLHWVRGDESLSMHSPRTAKLQVCAFGRSVGTPEGGITAEAIVVESFDELDAKKDQVKGKIVIYNVPWVDYGTTVQYRSVGAARAAKYGAVAALTRSVTPFSMNTVHTGALNYDDPKNMIPGAAITVEDSHAFGRMQKRGQKIILHLELGANTLEPALTHNVIAEVVGSTKPEEIIVIGGHIDSWDLAQGAMDDGGGIMICYQAIRTLTKLGLRPKRTIRFVAWAGEEIGNWGANAYAAKHLSEVNNTILAFESDLGVFKPEGFHYTSGGDNGLKLLKQIAATLLTPLNTTIVERGEGATVDISPLIASGVPSIVPRTQDSQYFWFHHSPADTMEVIDVEDMDKNAAMLTAMIYVVADMDVRFPRN